MAQSRPNTKIKESLKLKTTCNFNKDDSGCDTCPEESLTDINLQDTDSESQSSEASKQKHSGKSPATSSIKLRSTNRSKADCQPLPDVGRTGTSPTTHSNMKTKQATNKEELDKSLDEDTVIEPKTRARKKASDINDDDKKTTPDEPKTSKETKKPVGKPKAVVKKRPLGIRKTLRSKKAIVVKEKVKNVIKQTAKRGRKPALKVVNTAETQDKETVPLIPASEIKKEPGEDTTPNSRSSSPRTAGRRQRLSSDLAMMKTMLGDSPGSLVIGPRTSPYSMRSERSNSPSMFEGKNLRSGKPRKVKNLLSEVVIKEQKKRRRLHSDSKTSDTAETPEDCKKLKRGRSCSRDGSEISKCSDNTESDLSMSETLNDTDSKELNKKLDKSKTDLDIDIENNVQISTIEKVPSLVVDSKLAETKLDPPEPSSNINAKDKKLSLNRSTSLDSDNNNSNRINLDDLNSNEIEEKMIMKTDNTLFDARSSILTSMSKTFNSKEMSKNIRKARRGRKVMAASRPVAPSAGPAPAPAPATSAPKNCITSTITADAADDKVETIDTLTKEINDLINDLDQNIDGDMAMVSDTTTVTTDSTPDQMQTKTASKFYGLAKPLNNGEKVPTPETPVKDKDIISPVSNENTPSKNDDGENIRLHYEEDSIDKPIDGAKLEIPYKCSPVASIDKLMDRLKEFEEFDKRRQMESKATDGGKPMMVTNDVVLIPKSGDIKPLKDIQSVRSPEKTFEKENVLSCFENNSAISIVKRDQVRKSTDIDMPNSVTLIKRNSFSSRKESTSSNHSKESDAISIFEKSLGKDVTLTEIRKSVDKSGPHSGTQKDLHQFATLHPNTPTPNLGGVVFDSSQVSITPRVIESKINSDVQIITKRKSRESMSRKSSESTVDTEDKMATIEKIKSPPHPSVSTAVSITPAPVAIKSPEVLPVETEALPPPIETIKSIEDITASEVPKVDITEVAEVPKEEELKVDTPVVEAETPVPTAPIVPIPAEPEKMEVEETPEKKPEETKETPVVEEKEKAKTVVEVKPVEPEVKPAKSLKPKSARNSIESQAGPSNVLNETPESQKRKENVLRTLGLLTHKAAKEAKIEKLKEKERIYGSNYGGMMSNKSKTTKAQGDYTGTLKTVIKLNRGASDKKKHRSSLKMTFQKSKYRSGKPTPEVGEAANEDDAYYTIERREGAPGAASDGGHRKSHYSNRLNNHDTEAVPEPVEPKEILNLVIPEKASSFSIHPGRLCMDQCFYCGGKFGLFDTPCHIAQIKSSERQKKVLDNEEKLTIDSCLCDACYRHVDRRANCPSYRKRPLGKQSIDPPITSLHNTQTEKPVSPPLEEDSEEEAGAAGGAVNTGRVSVCHTEGCVVVADHSIRRKWLIKMRSSVNKLLKLKCDYPGLHTLPLCGEHHRALAPLMACALCTRRITKHHNVHFINHGYTELNPYLKAASVPVQFTERPVLCKTCRYYCTLLQRPGHNDSYANAYRRKLLQIYNIEVPPISENETEDGMAIQEDGKLKKKQRDRPKSKQRKSTEPDKMDSESSERSERTSESTPEKEKKDDSDSNSKEQPLEEDIESLISSNKILVPNAKSTDPNHQSDGSEPEMQDPEAPILPLDKQTELQYLLQKQNNPAQFLPKPNLTTKQRNILKVHNLSGIQKPASQHRIMEKNSKRIHKLGQILSHKEKPRSDNEEERVKDGIPILKNISLNEECTIESIPNKRPADINTLKNKWQMSESFTQVKKNLSELSKNKPEHHKKISEVKYSNPVKRLETNPSISVRELFPGEEEMNLQCNIEFNNVKGVTPEGWEKCNTMIQYDVETKKLWNDLQRPYGNQSSFLRHLILLEKYFRSGDLVLSHNATPHAANYSDSVQSRLRAYDNVVNDTPRRSEPAISLIEFRKKPSLNGKSLLKTNLNESDKETKNFMPPPPSVLPKPKSKSDKVKSKPLPPELIAINTPNAQGRKAIQNVLHNIQQLVKGVSASDPTEIAAAPLPAATVTAIPPPKFDPPPVVPIVPPKEKKDNPKKEDTPKKTKTTSKPWRPTLMPITQENLAKIAREPTQIAVDGRTLPSLVQVMSSGKRYHITLQDYNKMCIMRREKLQQIQDGEKTKRQSTDENTVLTEIQPSNAQCAMLGNGGSVVQNIAPDDKSQDKKELTEMTQISSNAATILKNVGLKNITIAPIPQKTATVTSQTVASPIMSTSSLLVTSTPIKIPQLGPSVTIMSETVLSPPVMSHMTMPKIPRSLTVIPQTVLPPGVVLAGNGPGSMASAGPGSMASAGPGSMAADGQRP